MDNYVKAAAWQNDMCISLSIYISTADTGNKTSYKTEGKRNQVVNHTMDRQFLDEIE